ncbi:MAG: Vms1/Ankzf1 family peptidyl-tRNA hydrolase [Natronomonas sp.]
MLDDLLGRTELKERIEELKDERDSLQAQLDAEGERRAEAVRKRQTAEQRINRLEDRIADLEGQLQRESETIGETVSFRRQETLRSDRLSSVLDRIEQFDGSPESVVSAFVSDDETPPTDLRELLGDRVALVDRASPCLAVADDAGVVAVALSPPIAPEPFCEWGPRPRIDRSWFQPTGSFAVALIRSDLFALGVYRGTERIDFEGFQSDVKGDHSKGGFSQARFERRRDEQIANHLDRCREVLSNHDTSRLYVVGDRRLIGEFDADAHAAVDATGKPKPALDDAFERFWTTKLYGL